MVKHENGFTIMLVLTFAFAIVEMGVGIYTHSLALVSDAFHMISDSFAIIVGLVAARLTKRDEDALLSRFTYGWQRAEIVGALMNACFMMAIIFMLLLESIERFIEPEELEKPYMVLIVGSLGLVMNIFGVCLFHSHSHGHSSHGHEHDAAAAGDGQKDVNDNNNNKHKHRNWSVHAMMIHILGDLFGSILVIISSIINITSSTWAGAKYVDPIVTILIVLRLTASTIPIIRQVSYILLQRSPKHIDLVALKTEIEREVANIRNVHEFHVWQLVNVKTIASMHVVIRCFEQKDVEDVMRNIKNILHKHDIHSSTIQCEWVTDDVEQSNLVVKRFRSSQQDGENDVFIDVEPDLNEKNCIYSCAAHCEDENARCCSETFIKS